MGTAVVAVQELSKGRGVFIVLKRIFTQLKTKCVKTYNTLFKLK